MITHTAIGRGITLAALSVCLLASASNADAQVLRRVYGVADDEFIRAAWMNYYTHAIRTDTVTSATTLLASPPLSIWNFMDSLGVKIIRFQAMPWGGDDTLDNIWLTRPDPSYRIILSHSGLTFPADLGVPADFFVQEAGIARQVVFHPFDSARVSNWQNRFRTFGSNVTVGTNNAVLNEFRQASGERELSTGNNNSAGELIASDISFNWRPGQTNRFKEMGTLTVNDSTVQNASWLLSPDQRRSNLSFSNLFYLTVTGRLNAVPSPSAGPDDALLRVEIWYEVPSGAAYPIAGGGFLTASDTIKQLCQTIFVRKRQLVSPAAPNDNWGVYRDTTFEVDLGYCADQHHAGPAHDSSESKRFNIKVFWTGAETVKLRSVSLRDRVAELLLGNRAPSDTFRAHMVEHYGRLMYGPSWSTKKNDTNFRRDSLRVIAATDGVEHHNTEVDAFARIQKLLRDNFGHANDTTRVPGWTESGDMRALVQADDKLQLVSNTFGMTNLIGSHYLNNTFGTKYGVPPAVAAHNGGRFVNTDLASYQWQQSGVPLLEIGFDSVNALQNVEDYEESLQRIVFGSHYAPTGTMIPPPLLPNSTALYPGGVSQLTALGRQAELASATKRRLILVLFNTSILGFGFRENDVTKLQVFDTGISRIPEASELRCMVNLGLCYGATGLMHQVPSAATNIIGGSVNGSRVGYNDSWGAPGPGMLSDHDYYQSLRVTEPDVSFGNMIGTNVIYSIPRMYTGWGTRYREMRRVNKWLADTLGSYLTTLRWKTAYSVNFTVPQTWAVTNSYDSAGTDAWRKDSLGFRPFPANEIVQQVNARSTRTGRLDSAHKTYVEIGIFKPISGAKVSDEVNHVMIVNKRCFERGDDSLSGAVADTATNIDRLAAIRTIYVRLNMQNFGQFNFVRVREMYPDHRLLIATGSLRQSLDTIIHADSAFSLTVGPGRAALMRISYVQPDTNMENGKLAYANQRKIVWDPVGSKYHCTYMMTSGPNGIDTSSFDSVCYRRSYPMTDSSGSILWEPKWYVLSRDPLNQFDSVVLANRHPSLTIRPVVTRLDAFGDTLPAGSAVTIVWTGHRNSVTYPSRQVFLRMLWSPNDSSEVQMSSTIEVVDSNHFGHRSTDWGTPVVSRADGADIIAWSDSLVGIKAVARIINDPNSSEAWWSNTAIYTDTIHVSAMLSAKYGRHGKYPSLPTFAHIKSRDSNVAVVWEQPMPGAIFNSDPSDICFIRLQHKMVGSIDTLVALKSSLAVVNPWSGRHRHPSISQHQDFWQEVQDVVTWETLQANWFTPRILINVRSIFTETRNPAGQPDMIAPRPQLWGWAGVAVRKNGLDWLYPNVCSINYRDSTDAIKAVASIAHNVRSSPTSQVNMMAEVSVQWAAERMKDWRTYTYGGRYLSNSETPDSQYARHAVLYQYEAGSSKKLRTTREFFLARQRPVGYMADGRQLAMRMNDSAGAGISFLMADVWTANDDQADPVELIAKDTSVLPLTLVYCV